MYRLFPFYFVYSQTKKEKKMNKEELKYYKHKIETYGEQYE